VGGLGLNLTSADTLVFVEHDWNPMRDLQVTCDPFNAFCRFSIAVQDHSNFGNCAFKISHGIKFSLANLYLDFSD
jgi:hypothetical protein